MLIKKKGKAAIYVIKKGMMSSRKRNGPEIVFEC